MKNRSRRAPAVVIVVLCLLFGSIYAKDRIILKSQKWYDGTFIEFEDYEYAIFQLANNSKPDRVLLSTVDMIILENRQIIYTNDEITDMKYVNKVNQRKIKPRLKKEILSPVPGGLYITPGFSYVKNGLFFCPSLGYIFNDQSYRSFLGISASYLRYKNINIVSPSFIWGYELTREIVPFLQGSIAIGSSSESENIQTSQGVVAGLLGTFPVNDNTSMSLQIGIGKVFYEKEVGTSYLIGTEVTKRLWNKFAIQPSIEFGFSSPDGSAVGGLNFSFIL